MLYETLRSTCTYFTVILRASAHDVFGPYMISLLCSHLSLPQADLLELWPLVWQSLAAVVGYWEVRQIKLAQYNIVIFSLLTEFGVVLYKVGLHNAKITECLYLGTRQLRAFYVWPIHQLRRLHQSHLCPLCSLLFPENQLYLKHALNYKVTCRRETARCCVLTCKYCWVKNTSTLSVTLLFYSHICKLRCIRPYLNLKQLISYEWHVTTLSDKVFSVGYACGNYWVA